MLEKILNSKNLTNEMIEFLSKYQEPYTNRLYQHVYTLLSLQPLDSNFYLPIINNLIKSENQPIYSYEVKKYLRNNDKNLYEFYRDSFKKNPGVEEAFDFEIKCANKIPYKKPKEVKEIKLLDPLFIDLKRNKRKNNFEKKKIRRDTKIEAKKKIVKIIDDKKEYDEKIKHMLGKINSNK